MHESTCPPARLPLFLGLYGDCLAESLCWTSGTSRMPDGPPRAPITIAPPDGPGR